MKNTTYKNSMYCNNPRLTVFTLLALFTLSEPAVSSDIVSGQTAYEMNCVICHGDNSRSPTPGAANFSRGDGLFKSDMDLFERIKKGKNACPSFEGILREQQIFDVIAYLRTLF